MTSEDKPTDAEEIFSEFQKQRTEETSEPDTASETKDSPDPEVSSQPDPEVSSQPESSPSEQTPKEEPSEGGEAAGHGRNVIFVGTKPIMTYVTATLTQLASEPTVTIKARGKRITQAVDVSQMIVKRMDTVGYNVKEVRIASDSLTSQDGRQRNVSTIEIDITKS